MTITALYGCCQIELSVGDLTATREFMMAVLGAVPIEQQLAKQIGELFPDGGYRVDHLDIGQATFQLNEPSPALSYAGQKSIHQDYQDRIGNCVTNLNFFVDDAVHAADLLMSLGAPTHIQGPSCAAACLADYGPQNTRPGADERKFYFMGSRPLIGFDLEFMEPNFLRFTQQAVQYPCFVRPRPGPLESNLKLQRLRLVVPDLEASYRHLTEIFAPASRSKVYDVRIGARARAFRIGLGGIELEYWEPRSSAGYVADQLERFGPGVIAIDFSARELSGVLDRVDALGRVSVDPEGDWLGVTSISAAGVVLGCRRLAGFDVVIQAEGGAKLF